MLDFIVSYADNFLDWGFIVLKVVIAWGLTFFLAGFFVLILLAFLAIWWEWLARRVFDLRAFGGGNVD